MLDVSFSLLSCLLLSTTTLLSDVDEDELTTLPDVAAVAVFVDLLLLDVEVVVLLLLSLLPAELAVALAGASF